MLLPPSLAAGLRHEKSLRVEPALTVPGLPSVMGDYRDFPPVLATPYLISFVESACIETVADHLPPGAMTVGTQVEMRHLAASPVGARLTARIRLTLVKGRRLRFHAECADSEGRVIGEGTHDRMVVDRGAFLAGLQTPPPNK